MTNFDFLKQEPKFNSFSDVAIAAEKVLKIDRESSVINCRRAMEFAIKWMYSVDKSLEMPYQDKLVSLMSTEDFHDLVDDALWKRLDLIRKIGNRAAHNGRKITEDEAILCLQNLFVFMDYVSYCYSDFYEERQYDVKLLTETQEEPVVAKDSDNDVDLQALIAENKALKEELTAKRAEQQQTYVPKPLDLSEYKTRKIYIDSMLLDAGWTEGKDWMNEVELPGMPNKSEVGFADYVLYDDMHRPLAVVEAKRTCVDVAKGRQQAKLYADLLEAQYKRRPVVFLTNGFETRIIDNQYPERKIAVIYSKRDLEKLYNLQTMKTSLKHISVDKKIAGRYYQEGAIKAVCDAFDNRNRRKALLVMATGSGKTRTVIALCKVLLDAGWVKNILFLADRNSLVTQAKRNFVNLLPDLSCSNLVEEKDNYTAEKILEVFNKQYPELSRNGQPFAKVIDNYMTYAQSAIDEFSDPKKMPQIAISVDMLDTGIDVPEVLNLVFFKKVMSKAKFWQMIGRGTRLCPELIDGEDKSKFYIFDFCGNFEFFRMKQGRPTANMIALQGAIFSLEFEIAYKLQSIEYQVDRLIAYRNKLVEMMTGKVQELNRENFAVRQHLKYVDTYSAPHNYQSITFEDTLMVREELAPLIMPDGDEASAVRFDALMYGMELAYLAGKGYGRHRSDLFRKVESIASVANIPEIQAQSELINQILHTDYVDNAGIDEFEHIRVSLRNLMKYLPKGIIKYDTDFTDEILSTEWNDSELENDELKNYKAKAEFYVRQHQDNIVIAKLKTNQPLTEMDIESLEQILWKEVGSKDDYEKEYGHKPLGEFVREIVGLDMNAAKEAFSEFLNDANLDSRQIYFVNQIVEYIVHNGMMKDLSVLQESPFTDKGSVVEIFTDLTVWMGIKKVIDQINANAVA